MIQYTKFHFDCTNGSGITAVWNFDLEYTGSRSRRGLTVMTYIYGPRSNNSFGVGLVSIGLAVLELRPFKTLTLKFRGEGRRRSKVSTYIYAHWPNDLFGLGFVSIGKTVLELWPFKNLTLIFRDQGQGQGQMSRMNFRALSQPYSSVFVSRRTIERLPRYRGGRTKLVHLGRTNTTL